MAAARRLGPLGLTDLLDETIRVYRVGFRGFVTAMAVPGILIVLWQILGNGLLLGSFGRLDRVPPPVHDNPAYVLAAAATMSTHARGARAARWARSRGASLGRHPTDDLGTWCGASHS